MKKQFKFIIGLSIILFNLNCFGPENLGESSVKGETEPFVLINEVLKLAKEKHPKSVFIGLKTANAQYSLLRLNTNTTIDSSYVEPTGTTDMWDFYFAKNGKDFIKKDEFLARPVTYDLETEDHFGIRYHKGTYYYIESAAFYNDSSILGQTTDLSLNGLLSTSQILSYVKTELRQVHQNDDIKVVAMTLKTTGYALPLRTSWRKQKGMTGPVWEISALLKDDKRGATIFLDAKTGQLIDETQGIVINKF